MSASSLSMPFLLMPEFFKRLGQKRPGQKRLEQERLEQERLGQLAADVSCSLGNACSPGNPCFHGTLAPPGRPYPRPYPRPYLRMEQRAIRHLPEQGTCFAAARGQTFSGGAPRLLNGYFENGAPAMRSPLLPS
jgi:hypothetical protein